MIIPVKRLLQAVFTSQHLPVLRRRRARAEGAHDHRQDLVRGRAHRRRDRRAQLGSSSSSTRRRPGTACSICACRRRRATRSDRAGRTARPAAGRPAHRSRAHGGQPGDHGGGDAGQRDAGDVPALRDELHMPTGLAVRQSRARRRSRRRGRGAPASAARAARATRAKAQSLLEAVAARAREEIGWTAINARYLRAPGRARSTCRGSSCRSVLPRSSARRAARASPAPLTRRRLPAAHARDGHEVDSPRSWRATA